MRRGPSEGTTKHGRKRTLVDRRQISPPTYRNTIYQYYCCVVVIYAVIHFLRGDPQHCIINTEYNGDMLEKSCKRDPRCLRLYTETDMVDTSHG